MMVPNGRLWCGGLLVGGAFAKLSPQTPDTSVMLLAAVVGIALTAWGLFNPETDH